MHAPTLPHPQRDARAARTLRARAGAWWLARHPRSDAWTLTQRNIYILPTRAGLAFGVTLLVMLLSSINYQLNLGYVLTFLLAGAGLVSMHQTHGTLRGLTLHLKPVAPGFAQEPAAIEVVLASPGAARHGVGLRFRDAGDGPHDTWVDVPALGQAAARLTWVPPMRGWHEVPPLIVDTRFPLGLFRAWTVWRPAARLLAWPAPERPAPPLPPGRAAGSETRLSRPGAGSELDGVRPWRRGDTLRQLAWKKVARTGELVSRDTSTESSRELWLDWQDTAAAGSAEARLSRLAAWVLAADQLGQPFGLRLPGVHSAADRGDAHRRDLLRELALWQ